MSGERSLQRVPDRWVAEHGGGIPDSLWRHYHGFGRHAWWAELVIPWAALGRAVPSAPPTLGLSYGRLLSRHRNDPRLVACSWPEAGCDPARWSAHGEALIGPERVVVARLELPRPRFGAGPGRAVLSGPWDADGGALRVATEAGDGRVLGSSTVPLRRGEETVAFTAYLDRLEGSHLEVFAPQRLLLELVDGAGA